MRHANLCEHVVDAILAQHCIGFDAVNITAFTSMHEVLVRYLRELSRCARAEANLSGRNNVNTMDILRVLDDDAGVFNDLARYVATRGSGAVRLPNGVRLKRESQKLWGRVFKGMRPSYIPNHLEKLPARHMYCERKLVDDDSSYLQNIKTREQDLWQPARPNFLPLWRGNFRGVHNFESVEPSVLHSECHEREKNDHTMHNFRRHVPKPTKDAKRIENTVQGNFSVYEVGPSEAL